MNTLRKTLCAAAMLAAVAPFALAQDAEPPFSRQGAPTTWEHPAYDSAEAQYMARLEAAGGDSDEDDLPDWSGLWENAGFAGASFSMRPGERPTGRGLATVTTMRLTPRYAAEHEMRIRQAETQTDFDPLSWCLPSGYPRSLASLFYREFAPQRGTTFLINELQNEVRRIYTDGRGHMSPEFAYPLWEGDSIGFWDGDTLVVWVKNVKGNLIGRHQPAVSDRLQSYEEWSMVDENTMRARVTFYDPEALQEPFDFIRYYQRVDNPDGQLRALYFACNENQNVVMASDGSSDFGFVPGVGDAPNLSDAETWLMFEEAEEAGLVAEFETAAAAGE